VCPTPPTKWRSFGSGRGTRGCRGSKRAVVGQRFGKCIEMPPHRAARPRETWCERRAWPTRGKQRCECRDRAVHHAARAGCRTAAHSRLSAPLGRASTSSATGLCPAWAPPGPHRGRGRRGAEVLATSKLVRHCQRSTDRQRLVRRIQHGDRLPTGLGRSTVWLF